MSNTGRTMTALFTGAAVGVGLGILFAPDKGSVTREKIKENYDEAKNSLAYKLQNASEDFKHRFSNTKRDLESTYDDLLSNMSNKTEDVISFLEMKLAELKDRNNRTPNTDFNKKPDYKEPNTIKV